MIDVDKLMADVDKRISENDYVNFKLVGEEENGASMTSKMGLSLN